MGQKIEQVYPMGFRKPKWWERVLLAFLPLYIYESKELYLEYKVLKNKMYIVALERKLTTLPQGLGRYN